MSKSRVDDHTTRLSKAYERKKMYLTAITAFPANELRLTLMDADDTLANGQTVRVTLKNIGGKLVVTREFTEAEDENLLHRAAAELAAALRDSELMEYSFTLKNGEEIKHKDLSIKSMKCKNSEFDDDPEIIAYVQVKDLTSKNKNDVFVFNGWMFSSSPSIAPFDHPVYDIWLVKCY